jgi:hypothetical protein
MIEIGHILLRQKGILMPMLGTINDISGITVAQAEYARVKS